jgi:hypothetical protein
MGTQSVQKSPSAMNDRLVGSGAQKDYGSNPQKDYVEEFSRLTRFKLSNCTAVGMIFLVATGLRISLELWPANNLVSLIKTLPGNEKEEAEQDEEEDSREKRAEDKHVVYDQPTCKSDYDCSYNGECTTGSCACFAGWAGRYCHALDLAPTSNSSGLNQLHTDNTSTW